MEGGAGMTPKQITELTSAVNDAMRQRYDSEIERLESLLPGLIRRELQIIIGDEIRRVIRKAVEKRVYVDVSVRGK